MSQASMIRPLSIHEASFPIYAKCSPGAGNIVSVLTIEGYLSEEAYTAAVTKVINSNDVLRATYEESTLPNGQRGYQWVFGERAPRVEIIELSADQDIEEIAHQHMECLMNEPFSEGEPLSRFLLIKGADTYKLFVCVSHASIDGSSITGILRRIVHELAHPQSNKQPVATFPPALWTFMPGKLSSKFGIFRCINILALLVKLQKQADSGAAFSVETPAPALEHRCIISRRQLTQAQSLSLVALSKRSKVSVHGLLGAAALQAFVDHMRTERGESFCDQNVQTKVPLVSTMDLRRRTEPTLPDNLLGCLSSGATHTVACYWNKKLLELADYTDLAARVDTTLSAEISKQQYWKLLRIYQTLGLAGMKKIFRDSAEKPMSMPISLANLGRLQFPSSASLHVVRFEGAPAFHANGPSVNIQSYTTNDQMTLSFSGATPQMSRKTLESFADKMLQHLINMG